MARYQVPENPKRPRRNRRDSFDFAPIIGFLLGLIVTAAAIFFAYNWVTGYLETAPLPVDVPEAVVITLTAPATDAPTPTRPLETPTTIPTLTPEPTPDFGDVPEVVTVNYYAEVTNTGGAGLSVRGGPSTDNIKLVTAEEGAIVLVLEGPTEGSSYTWWKVLLDDGTEGWMAAQFLVPAPAPEGRE